MQATLRPIDAAVLDANLNGASVMPVAEALHAMGRPFIFATGYGKIDAAVLSALVTAVEKDPSLSVALFRYLHSVGLVDEGTTLDGLLSAAAEAATRAEQDQIDAATPPADPSLEDAPDAED